MFHQVNMILEWLKDWMVELCSLTPCNTRLARKQAKRREWTARQDIHEGLRGEPAEQIRCDTCVMFLAWNLRSKVADLSLIHFRKQSATDGTKPDLTIGETRVWRLEKPGYGQPAGASSKLSFKQAAMFPCRPYGPRGADDMKVWPLAATAVLSLPMCFAFFQCPAFVLALRGLVLSTVLWKATRPSPLVDFVLAAGLHLVRNDSEGECWWVAGYRWHMISELFARSVYNGIPVFHHAMFSKKMSFLTLASAMGFALKLVNFGNFLV